MAAENTEYERVLGELNAVCEGILDLCGEMNLDKIKKDLQVVSQKSKEQMQRLNKFEESYSEAMSALEEERKENAKLNIQLTQAKTDLSAASQAQTEGQTETESMKRLVEAKSETDEKNKSLKQSEAEVTRLTALWGFAENEKNALKQALDLRDITLNDVRVKLKRELDTKDDEITNLTLRLGHSNSQLMDLNREISELRASNDALPLGGVVAQNLIRVNALENGGPDGGMHLLPVVTLVPVVAYVDTEIIPAIMPPPVVHRKYTEDEIKELLNQIEANVYLNTDIPVKFKSQFTQVRAQGILLNKDSLEKLIEEFGNNPFQAFSGDRKYYTMLLKNSKEWKSGLKNTAIEHLRSLNI